MANSPVVSSLPAYTEEHRDVLISNSVLGCPTAKNFTLQSGIKNAAALNILSSSITFGDGASCGWNEAGTSTFTQRTLTTGQIKVNMAICDKAMLGKWMEYQVRIGAGQKTLPFEEDFAESIVGGVQEALEGVIWNGDTTSLDANLKRFDGMLKILANDNDVIDETIASGSSYFAAVQQVLLAIPAGALKDDTVIFCSPSFFRAYLQELVALNYYHYNPQDSVNECVIPGSNVKLIQAPGIGTSKKLVAGRLSNFFYGCDLMDDKEKFELWYSQDNREFRLAIEFNAGVQVAFPAEVVLGAYSTLASPNYAAAIAAGVAEIADDDHVFKTDEQA